VATAEYRLWNSRGRPYSVALPIRQFVDLARAAGVAILGVIGNESHLQASTPEDHTPFSRTAWPNVLIGYIVTACDIADGPWSDRILAMAKAGQLPQVKYLNFRGNHYNVKRGWKRESSSDRHLHISVRTDHLNTALGVNPFTSAPLPPAQTRKGARPMILGMSAETGQTVYLGDGWKSKPLTSMDQANNWQSAGAVWKTYPSAAALFADIGTLQNGSALDRIEAALKAPAAVTLTPEQLSYFATSVASAVIKGLLDAFGALIRGRE
jgi:hypothetical protein